jgi:hypothetical protein
VRLGAIVAAAALSASCVPGQGPLMSPGENCLECHGGGTLPGGPPTVADAEDEGPRWTIAGTVYRSFTAPAGDGIQGAKVHVRDAAGRVFTLRTNRAGNFYTAERVQFPVRVILEYGGDLREMELDAAYGGCNACHRLPPLQDAAGRISMGL